MKALVLALSLLASVSAQAATLVVGDSLNTVELQDQHEQTLVVDQNTRIVLFSRGMKGGDIIKAALESLPQTEQAEGLVYVADISGMPSLIAKFVAIPQMQDLPFQIALDREGQVTQQWLGNKDSATVMHLQQLKIVAMTQVDTPEALVAAIK
ncbi:hypothetical protein [Shewanella algidipiscicola]|uniref:hypothetical protein n=1 Tax=Shewanella algidipiscicola TaxID=614070 RepID=UPI000D7828E3|nr:hypothetical protein [Shewanella algidipiscicola]